jgi:hypothetical protein
MAICVAKAVDHWQARDRLWISWLASTGGIDVNAGVLLNWTNVYGLR